MADESGPSSEVGEIRGGFHREITSKSCISGPGGLAGDEAERDHTAAFCNGENGWDVRSLGIAAVDVFLRVGHAVSVWVGSVGSGARICRGLEVELAPVGDGIGDGQRAAGAAGVE